MYAEQEEVKKAMLFCCRFL